MLSYRFVLLICGLALTSGCGFQPLYGKKDNQPGNIELLSQVRILTIKDRVGQRLRNYLVDRMNPGGEPGNPRYELAVNVTVSKIELGIERDETATRAKLTLTANYQLRDIRSNAIVTKGVAQSVNSFNIVVSDFATQSAEADARDRAAREASEEIRTQVSLFLNRTNR